MERRSPRIIDCPSGLLISPFVSHLSGLNVCVSGVSDVWSGHQRAVLKLKAVKLKSGDFYVFLLFSSLPPPLGPLTTAHDSQAAFCAEASTVGASHRICLWGVAWVL